MAGISIGRATLDRIIAQAEREFPDECCGFVIGDDGIEEVREIPNVQNAKHAEDPATYPRDARTAFLMEPRAHLAVMREIDQRRFALKIVYHSHPNHEAYFSSTDRARACSFDSSEPDYPGTVYLVLSILKGKFARAAAFAWDDARRDFSEVELIVR
jgi:proteasome lid subunit RPN8/RPN11